MRVGASNVRRRCQAHPNYYEQSGPPPPPPPQSSYSEKPFNKIDWAYAVLGVDPNVSDDKLKKAYKNACRDNHPDKASDPQDAKMRAEKFKMIQLAIQVINQQRGGR
jgi:DnaJ-class molecular chaperone